jgi:SAM-dependent methyltransferase
MSEPNGEMRAGWSESAAGWVANEAVIDRAFAPVTDAILAAADLDGAARLLDVGCGSGTLLAETVARGVAAVGVDISPPMVEAARARVPSATVVIGDAQTDDLLALAPGPSFDRVVSRFGVMFFADPRAAFANLRAACSPGARLALACWRSTEENPNFTLGSRVIAARSGEPLPVSGQRGPTAFADGTLVREILTGAGWSAAAVQPLDFSVRYGSADSDGVEDRLAFVLSRTPAERLRASITGQEWAELIEDVRADIRTALTDGGVVVIPGAVWIVTARA